MQELYGGASYYNLPGNKMANGLTFDGHAMNAAMHVPLGTVVEVTSLQLDGLTISVEITDRGPYVTGRIIDLTPTAFQALAGGLDGGVMQVKVQVP